MSIATETARINFNAEKLENCININVSGSLDLYTAPKLNAVINLFLNQGVVCLILNLTNLIEIDFDTASYLRDVNSDLEKKQGGIKFVGIQGKKYQSIFEKIFKKLQGLFFHTVTEAEDSFKNLETVNINSISHLLMRENMDVELSFPSSETFVCTIAKLLHVFPDKLVFTWPKDQDGKLISLNPVKGIITFRFLTILGMIGFSSSIILKPDTITPKFEVIRNFSLEKTRMRAYERIMGKYIITYRLFDSFRLTFNVEKAISTNISGGGINILTKIPMVMNSYYQMELFIENLPLNPFIGKIVRSQKIDKGEYKDFYDNGVMFHAIYEGDRNALIKYIIQQKTRE